jgi:predicted esterase
MKIKMIWAVCILLLPFFPTKYSNAQVKELKEWLGKSGCKKEKLHRVKFANKALSHQEALEVYALLYKDRCQKLNHTYQVQWDKRVIKIEDHSMPFFYNVFGEKPADGRSLYISLHGGGSAPAEVNDQQYENQKHLYNHTMKDLEGVYLAMRAPTDTWNMWHQDDIDDFIDIIIQMAVIKENVNPDKVYLLGYSAGGDGVYQLAPRMADRFAAASMMAGHPNDAQPDNLYNLPFALHVGGEDAAYDRNVIGAQWSAKLDSLGKANPGHYLHQAKIHEGLPHWMNLEDAIALPWMSKYRRNVIPEKVIWKQDDRTHQNFYWLSVEKPKKGDVVIASYDRSNQQVHLESKDVKSFQLYFNDSMLDLDQSIEVFLNGKLVFEGKLKRTIATIHKSLHNGIGYHFTSKLNVN